MNKKFLELYKDYPEPISDSINMLEANSIIHVYEGEYSIKNQGSEIVLQGKIAYEWLANTGVYFYGIPTNDNYDIFKDFLFGATYSVFVEGVEFGKGFILNIKSGNSNETKVKGKISGEAVLGDKSIIVEKLKFSIPNLREFLGLPLKRITKSGISTSSDRLIFEDEKYKIIIDKCSDYKGKKDGLEEKGGYIILYNGELIAKRGNIKHAEIDDFFHCFNTFLTFINGRRTSALFIKGLFEEQVIWEDFSDWHVDTYKKVQTWTLKHSIANLNELWKGFRTLWKSSEEDKNFLTGMIHWYVEANSQSGFLEGSIILAQTALELVYNWWIVENKKMILGNDSDNISASNKIRLLISQLNIPSSIPITFTELQKFKDSNDSMKDAPGAIVDIRNAIVHSHEAKRKKLSLINNMAIYEALQIYLWYIELSMLCILDYNGDYSCRCSNEIFAANSEKQVPWKK